MHMSKQEISNNELAILIKENAQQIEILARITKEGFDDMGARLDRLEIRVSNLEVRVAALEADIRTIKNELENVKLRLASLAPSFEVETLHRRVARIEVQVEQMQKREMQRVTKLKKK